MQLKSPHERILFGLKIKQLRQARGLNFAELAQQTGMSISYLNEIEKGKKFPRAEKMEALAAALRIDLAELTSQEMDGNLAPVEELLQSRFLNELPLDLFGIELNKVVEIIAGAPIRVGAFISALLELSRNYAVRQDNFYFSALRAYLELHHNYFQDIEDAVERFVEEYRLPAQRPLSPERLKRLLEEHYGYTVLEDGLEEYPELRELRSVFLPTDRRLLLNGSLTPMQRAFQFGKELAFQYLQLPERALTSSIVRGVTFEQVLNHSRATYFSVALHLPLQAFVADMRRFFANERWDGEAFLSIMRHYAATPEMFYHRLTNVLPHVFNMPKLFFLRFLHDPLADEFTIDKELHLNRRHHPHGNGLFEHYCRRWVSITLLQDLYELQRKGVFMSTVVRAQRSRYIGTEDEYLCLTLARPAYPTPNQNVSVTLGLLINEDVRRQVRFLDDPAIQFREVNNTCERCPLPDCLERAAPPTVVESREKARAIKQRLRELGGG